MSHYQQELPAEGLTTADIKIQRGTLTIRAASVGQAGSVSFDRTLTVTIRGERLEVSQPEHDDDCVEVVLPATVRDLRCATGLGEVRVEGVLGDVDAATGKGAIHLAGGRGRTSAKTGWGEIGVSGRPGALDLATGLGDILVEGVQDEVKAATGKGDVKVDEVRGLAELRSGAGHLVANRLGGRASLHTGWGDVQASAVDGARVEARTGWGVIALGGRLTGLDAKTGHGDIVCRCELGAGSYDLTSGRGDVRLDLPADAEVRIDAVSRHGQIETNLPLVKVGGHGPESRFGRRLVGAVGVDPRAEVSVRTGRGDIRIFRGVPVGAEPAPEAQPERAAAAADPELAILEAVSRGEVSVDEALALLKKA